VTLTPSPALAMMPPAKNWIGWKCRNCRWSELRVVEIGSGDALCYCGKLFADFGAEVIKVEPPGGDARAKNRAAGGCR